SESVLAREAPGDVEDELRPRRLMGPMLERLVAFREHGRLAPVFCIHPIGGHVNEYERLAALLEDERPAFGLRSRACLAPEREHATVAEMAAEYAEIVRSAAGARPVVVFGWSFGAVVAHATACELGDGAALVGMADPVLGAPPGNDDPR